MLSSHLTRKVTQLRPHSNSMAERDWNPRGPDSSPKMDASLDFPLAGLSSAPSRCLLDAEQGRRLPRGGRRCWLGEPGEEAVRKGRKVITFSQTTSHTTLLHISLIVKRSLGPVEVVSSCDMLAASYLDGVFYVIHLNYSW